MPAKKTLVKVHILGEEYTIRSDASAEHTRAVAEHVDDTIRRIMQSGSVVETHKAAILAALQIAGEYFRAREADVATGVAIADLSEELRRWLPPGKRAQ
jgi:cell division protein ZapA